MQQQQEVGKVGASPFVRLSGSALDSQAVRNALQALGQDSSTGEIGASIFQRGTGSALDSANVRSALEGMQQAASQTPEVPFKRSTGSSFDSEKTLAALQALQQLDASQVALGASPYARPTGSNITPDTAPKVEQLAQIDTRNTAIYMAHNALNGGEIAPEMLARFDQPRYQTGCEVLLNMVPLPQGGITKRPGMLAMALAGNQGACPKNTPGRLFPFIFSTSETRLLEFYAPARNSRARLRVWSPNATGTFVPTETTLGNQDDDGHNLDAWRITGAQLSSLCLAQSADVLYVAHVSRKPGKIMRTLDDDGNEVWSYEELVFLPTISAPASVWHEGEGDGSGSNAQVQYSYVVTAIDDVTGEESLPSYATTSGSTQPLSSKWHIRVKWTPVEGASEYRVYRKEAGVYGFIGRVDAEEGVTEYNFLDDNITPDTEDSPPRAKDPFQGTGNYPSVVFFHQQRLGFASTDNQPLTLWLSQAGNFENLSASLPPEDDDGIEVTLAATQANRIVWAMSDRNALAVGTTGGEWILQATEGAALTPSDLSFQPQTSHGSQTCSTPVLREFQYSFSSDRYESGDLGILARHILRGTGKNVVHWAWQDEPYGILWCCLEDGTLAAVTYMKEHDVIGWHRHETAGKVLDVTSLPGTDGNSIVFFLVERGEGDAKKRYVERLRDFFHGGTPAADQHVDGVFSAEFTARCIPCLPESNMQNGSSFLHVRKINAVKARVIHSSPFKAQVTTPEGSVGAGSRDIYMVPALGSAKRSTLEEKTYLDGHGDWAVPLASGWRENDRLELIFDGPEPATVLGIVATVEVADMAGNQK